MSFSLYPPQNSVFYSNFFFKKIDLKKVGYIQQTINAFLDSEVHGYNRERIIALLRIYKDLKQKGESHRASDVALLTRCDLVDIKVTRDEVLTRIRYLLPEIKIYDANGKNISKSGLKKEVFRWISSPTFLNDRRMLKLKKKGVAL